MTTVQEHLLALANADELNGALEACGRLEESFGFDWRPVGDRENNYGMINIGSDPGIAMIERVTNALDAVLEDAYLAERRKDPERKPPPNPRAAAERWFDIEAGRIRNLDLKRRQDLADRCTISLHPGTEGKSHPTLKVRDLGIGLSPEAVPDTILSLGGGNKIDKPFLAGAFGQGGSTTFAFSRGGTRILSRRNPAFLNGSADRLSVTLVRFRDLDPTVNKNGRFEYLADSDGNIPSLLASDFSHFGPGTEVTHFNYDLAKYSAAMTQVTGSLWWLLQNSLFDPVLPLWAEDHRSRRTKKETVERRSITGNHARLWTDRNDKLEHSDSIQIHLPHPEGDSRVTAHYWVAALPEDSNARTRPIEVYVDPFRPVTYTYFGQTHGTEDQRFIRDRLQMPYLDRFLILQIELDQLSPYARRDILSTTRDRLKESVLYDDLRERLATGLAEDPTLVRLNDERREALLSSYSETERQRMRERFARLLTNLIAGRDADVGSGSGKEGGREKSGSTSREPLEPLPTKDRPTFLSVVNSQKPVRVQVDRAAVLRLESDAPDGYLADHDPLARLVVASDPERSLVMESRSDFRGGRSRVLVRPGSDVKAGAEGEVTVFLMTPEGDTFQDKISYRVVDPVVDDNAGDKKRGKVKAPEPIPIYCENWGGLGWTDESVAQVDVDDAGDRILVNMDNRHIVKLLTSGGYKEQGLARMKGNYLLYCSYYAWLQHRSLEDDDHGLSGEEFERYREEELDRAAQTVINAIAAEGRLS